MTSHFDSAAQMLDFFHLPKDGTHYRRLLEGLTRLFAATIFFGTEEHPNRTSLIHWARFHFFDNMRLWFNRNELLESSSTDQDGNVVTQRGFLSRDRQHRIPVEREVVAALTHCPHSVFPRPLSQRFSGRNCGTRGFYAVVRASADRRLEEHRCVADLIVKGS
jgi:hypothetical protein